MANVQLIGLKTGEQILSQVEQVNDNQYLLKKPAILVPAAEKGIGIAPWLPYTKASNGVTINDHAINFMVEPVEELKSHYMGSFVGGLVLPSTEMATPQLQLTE